MSHKAETHRERRGVILVLSAILMVALVGMVAFAVDHGYLLKIRTDLQRAADASALAAVQDLIRKSDGTQVLSDAQDRVRTYARDNLADPSLQVASADIEIGRYDPQSVYSHVTLLNTGTFDTVRVTLRRDGAINSKAPLFFARVLGLQDATVTATATAILQKAELLEPGAEILPFATPLTLWDSLDPGDTWTAYGSDGEIWDENDLVQLPGHWGTLDVGSTNNATSDLVDQINNGLRQSDLDALYADNRIAQSNFIDSAVPTSMQGDPGLSAGIKSAVIASHLKMKLIPIFDDTGDPFADVQGGGEKVEIPVIGWGAVQVMDSSWNGNNNTWVRVKKRDWFNGKLRPKDTLSATSGYVDGAYTTPVLVE